MKCSLDTSTFLEEIFILSHSIVFLISLHCSVKKVFLSLLAVLWNSTFNWICLSLSPMLFASLLSSAICKASSDNHFIFLHFFFGGWFWSLPPVQYYEPPSILFLALHLSDLIPWIHLSFNCIIMRDLIILIMSKYADTMRNLFLVLCVKCYSLAPPTKYFWEI